MSERKEWDGKFVQRRTKIESWNSAEERARYKIVRADNGRDVPGVIVSADELSGECNMHIDGETKTLSFPGGLRIVKR